MTKTYEFGSGKRESHDSSAFYSRFDFRKPTFSRSLGDAKPGDIDRVYFKSSEDMSPELPDNSVALMFTSPPYHVGKEYDTNESFDDYLDLLWRVFAETYRVLEPGGRAVINVANLGRAPYIPLTTYVDAICQEIGYLPRGQVLWIKGKGASGSCAWGTWLSPVNPVLRDLHEYLLVYSKGDFRRVREGTADITKEEFLENTLSVWNVPPASAKRIGHPAPFPLELPLRAIKLYTYVDDLVLDPFIGSGTTAVAAKNSNRRFIGYETEQKYSHIIDMRLREGK